MPGPVTCYTISPSSDSTLAIEVSKTRLRRRKKHILFFEEFDGEMCFAEGDPGAFTMTLTIAAASAVCRDASLSEKKRRAVAEFARDNVLEAGTHREIRFTSNSIRPKALRGFVVEGMLQIRGIACAMKASTVLGPMRRGSLQIDGDATLRLGDFGLATPTAMFGLVGTKDEVVVRILLWATPRAEVAATTARGHGSS